MNYSNTLDNNFNDYFDHKQILADIFLFSFFSETRENQKFTLYFLSRLSYEDRKWYAHLLYIGLTLKIFFFQSEMPAH